MFWLSHDRKTCWCQTIADININNCVPYYFKRCICACWWLLLTCKRPRTLRHWQPCRPASQPANRASLSSEISVAPRVNNNNNHHCYSTQPNGNMGCHRHCRIPTGVLSSFVTPSKNEMNVMYIRCFVGRTTSVFCFVHCRDISFVTGRWLLFLLHVVHSGGTVRLPLALTALSVVVKLYSLLCTWHFKIIKNCCAPRSRPHTKPAVQPSQASC